MIWGRKRGRIQRCSGSAKQSACGKAAFVGKSEDVIGICLLILNMCQIAKPLKLVRV
jgi:hypothetical protein